MLLTLSAVNLCYISAWSSLLAMQLYSYTTAYRYFVSIQFSTCFMGWNCSTQKSHRLPQQSAKTSFGDSIITEFDAFVNTYFQTIEISTFPAIMPHKILSKRYLYAYSHPYSTHVYLHSNTETANSPYRTPLYSVHLTSI